MPSDEQEALHPAPTTFKKHVAAIHISADLSLVARKLINVLIPNAYKDLLKPDVTHELPLTILCALVDYTSRDMSSLKSAITQLASSPIQFDLMGDSKKKKWRVMSMLSYGEIEDGIFRYRFDKALAEELYDPERYTLINSAMQREFDSNYALALYENCLRYKDARDGSTGWWEIEKFRRLMNATAPMYDEFKYLKRDVINKPVEQVNRVSDIHIEFETRRESRKVTGIKFTISENKQTSLLKPQAFDQYSEIRENPTFKRLIKHNIGEFLALKMVVNDEARTNAIIDYVEKEDSKHRVKRTTAGYIRKLVDSGADVRPSQYEQEKAQSKTQEQEKQRTQAEEARYQEQRKTYQKLQIKEKRAALSTTAYQVLIDEYRAGEGRDMAKSYRENQDGDRPGFTDPIERIPFDRWLGKKLAPTVDAKAFKAWLKSQAEASEKENK
jgi:Initiator Replication protein